MSPMPPSDPKRKLANRLATKAKLPKEEANAFLEALLFLIAQEKEKSGFFDLPGVGTLMDFIPGHTITVPLVTQADGSISADDSAFLSWLPFRRKRPKPPVIDPGLPAPVPRPYWGGPYPGPCVKVIIDPKTDLDRINFNSLTDTLTNAKYSSGLVRSDLDKE
jgi:hypothetical protein